jgi:hypothetical protein
MTDAVGDRLSASIGMLRPGGNAPLGGRDKLCPTCQRATINAGVPPGFLLWRGTIGRNWDLTLATGAARPFPRVGRSIKRIAASRDSAWPLRNGSMKGVAPGFGFELTLHNQRCSMTRERMSAMPALVARRVWMIRGGSALAGLYCSL